MLRPARASSMMRRRYSGAYGGCVRGIGNLLFYFSPNTVHESGSTPLQGEAETVGGAALLDDPRVVGVIEVEVPGQLLGRRIAGILAVALALRGAQEAH